MSFGLIDVDKSSDLKKLKEREEQRKSKLDIINRRMSVSAQDLQNPPAMTLNLPNNLQRRHSFSLLVMGFIV